MSSDLLFERELALERLQSVLGSVRSGTGRAVLVTGVPGIGKTRLLNAVVGDAATSGVQCLRATGHLFERDYGFGVVRQLFGQLPKGVLDEALGSQGGPGRLAADGDELFGTLQALVGALTAAAAARPFLVLVDDAQWVDEPSLRFLHFLARRIESTGVGLVVAARAGEERGSAVLAELVDAVAREEIRLKPLSRDAVARMLGVRLGEVATAFVEQCLTWTRGNPLYLSELMATMQAEGIAPTAEGASALAALAPGTIGRLVLVRIARAGDAAVSLVQAVAVLGDGPSLPAAARLAGLEIGSAGAAAAALIRLDVLDDDLRFVHPVVREAVYDDLPGPLRATRHLAAAELLHELGAADEAIATQLVLAPATTAAWAGDTLRRAARGAVARGAPETAARFIGHVLGDAGDRDGGGDLKDRIDLDVTRTHLLWITGRSSEAIELADRTASDRSGSTEGHGDGGDDSGVGSATPDAMLAMKLMLQCVTPGTGRPSVELLDRFAALSGATQVERDCLLPVILYRTATGTPVDEIMPLVQRVIGRASRGAAQRRSPATWLFLLLHLGEVERTLAFAERYLAAAAQGDSAMWRAEALTVRALGSYRIGDIVQAEADAQAALTEGDAAYAVTAPVAAATLMYARLERGDLAGASAAADAFRFPSHREDTAFSAVAEAAIGRVRWRAGDHDLGLRLLRSAGERLDAVEWLITELAPWRVDAAQILGAQGHRDEALAVLQPAYEAARRFGAPSGLGRVLRVRAALEQPVSVDLLREAVATYADGPLRLKHAHALVDLGAALRRSGARSEARDPLAAGREIAHRCGATPLEERAAAEIAAAGGRPRSAARTGVEALTPAERRVAALARAGLRNAEIAAELFIQQTTVEKHLAGVFRKLSIDARTDIPELD